MMRNAIAPAVVTVLCLASSSAPVDAQHVPPAFGGTDAARQAVEDLRSGVPQAAPDAGAPAAGGEAGKLLERAGEAFAPRGSVLRTVEIVTRDPSGTERTWSGHEARSTLDGKDTVLLVLDAPASVRGFAVLTREGADATHEMWVYTPPVGRVRKLELVGMAQPFLGTDLTFADLGLYEAEKGTVRIAGDETIEGQRVTVVESIPQDSRAYARILTYVTETGRPLRKEYRDPADRPWRVLTYRTAADASGASRLVGLEVKDLQTGYVTELRYGDTPAGDVSDDLFDPAALARVAEEGRLADRSSGRATDAVVEGDSLEAGDADVPDVGKDAATD